VGSRFFGIDTDSGEVFADRWIAHTGNELEEFYDGLPAGAVVGVECGGNMPVVRAAAGSLRAPLAAGRRGQNSGEARKQKHDRRDAELFVVIDGMTKAWGRLIHDDPPLQHPLS